MNLKSSPATGSYLFVFILQIISFIVATIGVVFMIVAIKNNYASSAFMTGLFLSLLGSAFGVMFTLYSLRR